MSDHTPTPWGLDGTYVVAKYGPTIADCGKSPSMSWRERRANADFIIKAANTHDEMVRILTAIDKSWSETFAEGPDGDYGGISLADEHKTFWRDTRAVLALTSAIRKESK